MSKTKRFISMMLAAVMVFSVVSFELATVVAGSALLPEAGVTVTPPSQVSVSATPVARVAASANSLIPGNTLVKATPSGVPDLGSATYANAAYAGETPVWPSVSITLPAGITIDASPQLTITAETSGGSVSMSSVSKSGQTYSASVTGGTATAGNNIIYSVSYYYEGANYTTYAYTYVESIIVPSGNQIYFRPYKYGVTGTAGRLQFNYRFLGINVYGNEVAGSATHGYYNFAGGAFVDNPASPSNVQLRAEKDGGTGSVFNAGYVADDNRPQASVYIDTSTTSSLAQLNLRVNFFLYAGLQNHSTDNRLAASYVQAGNVNSVSAADSSSAPSTDATASAQLGITGTSGLLVNQGDTITATLNGPGPTVSGTSYTVTMKMHAPEGPDGNRSLDSYTSVCLTAYTYNKGALRAKVADVISGAGGKGINPQSWYYSSGWDYFKASLDNANLVLNKPNTDQAAIDSALLFLTDSYNSLFERVFTYTVNSYIQGTTTPLIPAVSANGKYSGYVLYAVAENISGYTLTNPASSPAKVSLSLNNRTINFYYTPNPYTITFDANGGTPVSPITAGYATTVLQPGDPSKTHYMFTGWFSDAELTQSVSWPLQMPIGGLTLYAGWSLIPVTLAFDSNNGSPVESVTEAPGTIVPKPDDPTRETYSFEGWFYDIAFTQPVAWPVELSFSNLTLYAKWSVNQYTVAFESNGGTSVDPITVDPNVAVYAPGVPVKTGYTFIGWFYDDGTFANAVKWPIIILNTGYTVYAKWVPDSITITFDSQGGSAVAPLVAPAASAVTAPPPPGKFGYVFAGWTLDGAPFTFDIMPTQNTLLVAVWTESLRAAQVKLDTYKSVDGELVPATTARAGETITVTLAAKTNFYSGSSRFVIMYDSSFYTIIGVNKNAILPNTGNPYYANAISSYAGATTSPAGEWPITFVNNESSTYKFVAANFTASSQAANGGYPVIMNDDVFLYRIRLQIRNDASGSGHIFMDNRWDRSLSNPAGGQYYYYCQDGETLSSNGDSVLNFDIDYNNANKTIVLDTSVPNITAINFNTDGGAPIASVTGEAGKATEQPPVPEKAGYTFLGWSPAFPATFPENDITITALWQINTFYANFVVDGNPYATVPTQYGSLISAPANPLKTGYTFTGWSPAVGTMGPSDTTYTALFTINSYNAYFVVDGEVYDQAVTEFGAQILIPFEPYKTGYTFTGWSPEPGVMPAANTTFTAEFSVNSYYAYFVVDGQTVASVLTSFGTPIVPPANPEKPGHVFSGWSPAVGVMGAGDEIFTAVWDAVYYNANFYADSTLYTAVPTIVGEIIQIPPQPVKEGHTFTGWDFIPAVMPQEDVTINATWSINSYTAAFMVDGDVYTAVQTVFGASIELPAEPEKQGFTFTGWATVPATMPAEDITINAQFSVNLYNAVFKVDGEVYQTVPTYFGAEIISPANPVKPGYIFMGWLAVPVTMPAGDIEIEALFTVITYTATFLTDGEVYTTVTIPYGTVIEIPAEPYKTGYTFTGWNDLPVTMPDYNIEINAIFTKNIYRAVFMLDGEEYAVVEAGYGETIELPPVPSKTGHSFLAWNNLPDTMPNDDVVITGVWSVNKYDAVFIVDTQLYAMIPTDYGTAIQLPAQPTKPGFFFIGWSPEIPQTMPAAALEFTAVWASEAYYATFMVDGVEYYSVLTGIGAPIHEPAPPVKEGYIFLGWDPGVPSGMPAQDLVFNALWFYAGIRTVNFSLNGGSGTIPANQTGAEGTVVGLPAQGDIVRQYYIFRGWATAPDATEPLANFEIPGVDVTLYAVWQRVPVILTANPGSGAVVDQENGLIFGIEEGITIETLNAMFVQVSGEGLLRRPFDHIGNFGTGSKVELIDTATGALLKTYEIVIFGDVNGDGLVTAADRDMIKLISTYQTAFIPGSAFSLASDLNRDGIVDSFDLNILKAAVAGLGVIDQTNPGTLV